MWAINLKWLSEKFEAVAGGFAEGRLDQRAGAQYDWINDTFLKQRPHEIVVPVYPRMMGSMAVAQQGIFLLSLDPTGDFRRSLLWMVRPRDLQIRMIKKLSIAPAARDYLVCENSTE